MTKKSRYDQNRYDCGQQNLAQFDESGREPNGLSHVKKDADKIDYDILLYLACYLFVGRDHCMTVPRLIPIDI